MKRRMLSILVTDHLGTVGGGRHNQAGDANANNAGAFVLADSNNFDLTPGVNNAFTARFTGGARFILGINASGYTTWLCAVYNGGSWGCSSDRNVKANFQPVDGRDVLQKLMTVPITTWNAIGADPTVRRMGPMSQDFYAAFGLGDDDKVITTGDLQITLPGGRSLAELAPVAWQDQAQCRGQLPGLLPTCYLGGSTSPRGSGRCDLQAHFRPHAQCLWMGVLAADGQPLAGPRVVEANS